MVRKASTSLTTNIVCSNMHHLGTPDYVNHKVLGDYIQDVARQNEVESLIKFNTEVRNIKESNGKWLVEISTLQKAQAGTGIALEKTVTEFDSVVVASGHYHTPRVPDTPGLAEWKRRWPDRIEHSKRYRKPEDFKDKNVLLVGAGVSSTDIAREIGPIAKSIYQVHRNGKFDLPGSMLPENGVRVSEIESFTLPEGDSSISLAPHEPIPGTVTLKDGTKLSDIHRVILCTGYHVALPFLAHLHANIDPERANDHTLVTDGTQYHNLHKDIFYIPRPTLAFIGVPYFTATFTLFEFQAMVLAQVLSGKASLPTESEMKEEYRKRVEEKGYGKPFHSLKDHEVDYVDELLAWVNPQLEKKGLKPLVGHSETWKAARKELVLRMQKLFSGGPGKTDAPGNLVSTRQ
ncbi:FAD/NAD(P)-binding domain-containing protein [Mytilinidion resinicola]|uniref:FAD/NAD(P)-binding domain-containing protein n=1 Tax=Mytilinidion resinicola TaxID=574789 RepID=A0A6A6YKH0_9PEZI|nr:FAD/NAD(P)-binding domain-containing protein [Mytilinidion resinicola]KAF2809366.1 FAD/NAD(P)-binding domain-containing protein [Mytilinidion resinicola]